VLLAYSARNRSAACYIPYTTNLKGKRVEVRFPDPAANPYLSFAVMLMAGLDGIRNKIHPGDPMDKDLYDLPPEELQGVPTVCGSPAARPSARWRAITSSCSPAMYSAWTRSRATSNSSGTRCTASSTRRTRWSSRCTTPSDSPRPGCFVAIRGPRGLPDHAVVVRGIRAGYPRVIH
jgi:hypothetical protein